MIPNFGKAHLKPICKRLETNKELYVLEWALTCDLLRYIFVCGADLVLTIKFLHQGWPPHNLLQFTIFSTAFKDKIRVPYTFILTCVSINCSFNPIWVCYSLKALGDITTSVIIGYS